MATAAVTYTFANGTNADGTQVNSNFTSVVNFLNTETVQRDASIAFTAIPSLPAVDPTTDNQAVRKAYVDNFIPAGVITQYGAASAPTGWVLCQGQALSRTNPLYSRLFTAISTTYGAGDGTTTYNVPNLQGRIPVGRDSTQTEFDALAEVGGSKTSTLSTANLPSHQHGVGTITPNTIADHQHGVGTITPNTIPDHQHGVGTIAADTIANHVHAHSLSVAAHNANHSHTMDHSHTVSSTGSTSTTGPHQHVNAEIQFQGHIWSRYAYGYGNDYAIPLLANAGATPMAVGYGSFSSGEHNHNVSVSGTTGSPSNPSVANSTTLTSLVHSFSGSITADGGHSHVMSGSAALGGGHTHTMSGSAALGGGHTHTMSGSTALEGSGTSFSNLAPYIVVNYIIKL